MISTDIQMPSWEAAQYYIGLGWSILPLFPTNDGGGCSCGNVHCTSPGKHPLSQLVPRGVLDATTDQVTIEQWFAQWPDFNIGIALEPSGLVVVAPDSESWLGKFKKLGLPATAHAVSGGGPGHRHYYYARPSGCPVHRICKSGEYDILSGGYIVAPPSRHKSGRSYRWVGIPDDTGQLPDAPDWAVEMLAEAQARSLGIPAQSLVPADDRLLEDGRAVYDRVRSQLSDRIRVAIENGPDYFEAKEGADQTRSGADAAVCLALIAAGLHDDDIRSIYRTFPIGRNSKYAERGDTYLAATVAKMRTHYETAVVTNDDRTTTVSSVSLDEESQPYVETEKGIVWIKPVKGGNVTELLTNFRARILEDTIEDNGFEEYRTFKIEANLGGRARTVSVPAVSFPTMSWVGEHLGANAVVRAGYGLKDRAREAIQLLSGEITERRVYTHTGWREVDGEWVYLHAGGAIPKQSTSRPVDVSLMQNLRRFELPTATSADDLADAVRSSLRFLDAVPDEIGFPLYCSIWGYGLLVKPEQGNLNSQHWCSSTLVREWMLVICRQGGHQQPTH
jgi:hypothetical protein